MVVVVVDVVFVVVLLGCSWDQKVILFCEDCVISGSGGVFKLFCSPQHKQLLLVSSNILRIVVHFGCQSEYVMTETYSRKL